ncbi:hypothetical protein RUM43_004942 [Polyplax serrata]|uniref:Uncharacterized protein n=1 Tax=Polyplax serrata TaxID=468196 RepID=A0AAN8XQU4_POLSC
MSHGGESNGHLMEETDEEMNIIEASGGKEEPRTEGNNNFMTNDTTEDNDSNNNNRNSSNNNRSNVNTGSEGTRQRPYHQYPYQKDYQEALRSLLWEPYDCRKASDTWYYEGLDDDEPQADVSQQNFMSFSESSLSSCSSCSSLDEILTVEMTPKSALTPVDRYSLNIEKSRDGRRRCTSTRRDAARPSKMKDTQRTDSSGVLLESNLTDEKEDFISGFTEFGCSTDPVQNLMNLKKMVSDLDAPVEEEGGFGSYGGRDGALASNSSSLSSRTSQCVRNSCAREASCSAREKNVLSTVNKMLVTVEGTLEPRDSNEGTQLVSPDTSLDLNENPVRLSGQTRVEPGPSSSSSGNVSVVNCYRAVPVSVVSTVPTIKCLNTQENVSNVHIIQNNAGGEQKPAGKCPPVQAKKFPVRSNANACVANPVPSSSRIRTKAPRDGNRNQSRNSLGSEQTPRKIERERPKSMNGCASEQSGQRTPGLSENGPTSSNNGGSVLSNHSRSVSNPVLGNQAKPMSNKYGSQQNIPIRLETHFGPSCSEGTERSQTYLTQGNVSGPVTQVPVPTGENNVEQAREAGGNGNGTNSMPQKQSPRTFTSTEAQTDDVPLGIHPQSVINREQRRRERRERRHQRRLHQSVLNSGSVWQSNVDVIHRDRRGLPDILNSHMPPPYSAVPVPAMSAMPPLHVPPPMPVPPGPQTVPHLVDSPPGPPLPHQNGLRFLFPFPGGRR